MRCLPWAAALILLMPAAPALARGDANVQALAGAEAFDGALNLSYGFAGGYDFRLGGKGFAGVQATLDKSTVSGSDADSIESDLDLGVHGRIGLRTGTVSRAYLLAGISSLSLTSGGDDRSTGFRAGVGYEQGLFGKALAKIEYRFTTYGDVGTRNQLLVGFGLRF